MIDWGGRIRTFEYGIQSPAPYRLATPQYERPEALCQKPAPGRRRPIAVSLRSYGTTYKYKSPKAVRISTVAYERRVGKRHSSLK